MRVRRSMRPDELPQSAKGNPQAEHHHTPPNEFHPLREVYWNQPSEQKCGYQVDQH